MYYRPGRLRLQKMQMVEKKKEQEVMQKHASSTGAWACKNNIQLVHREADYKCHVQ
jgi:hypothetical protein